jgi:uncharacterized protein (DUF305 family)
MKLTRWSIAPAVLLGATIFLLAACGGDDPSGSAGGTTAAADVAFDRAFIDAMVPHHQSAIEMAKAAKDAGLGEPELVEVADAILATQQREIDRMKQWRGEWYGSSEIDPDGAAALDLTGEQMGMSHDADELHDSADVDADFARMMIAHHEGAVLMARRAEDRAEHRELKELAEDIVEAQEREIEVMEPHASETHHE